MRMYNVCICFNKVEMCFKTLLVRFLHLNNYVPNVNSVLLDTPWFFFSNLKKSELLPF
jgi:hypothetical protein